MEQAPFEDVCTLGDIAARTLRRGDTQLSLDQRTTACKELVAPARL